jgi:GNAT superfamily N-acetyltransferase
MRIQVNEFQQSFFIYHNEFEGAYINGHLTWGGEVFFVYVPEEHRRKGVAKQLAKAALKLFRERGMDNPSITSAISPEGKEFIKWFKSEVKK